VYIEEMPHKFDQFLMKISVFETTGSWVLGAGNQEAKFDFVLAGRARKLAV
jgi:hypothetical protein